MKRYVANGPPTLADLVLAHMHRTPGGAHDVDDLIREDVGYDEPSREEYAAALLQLQRERRISETK